jgi:hypothetical protein
MAGHQNDADAYAALLESIQETPRTETPIDLKVLDTGTQFASKVST